MKNYSKSLLAILLVFCLGAGVAVADTTGKFDGVTGDVEITWWYWVDGSFVNIFTEDVASAGYQIKDEDLTSDNADVVVWVNPISETNAALYDDIELHKINAAVVAEKADGRIGMATTLLSADGVISVSLLKDSTVTLQGEVYGFKQKKLLDGVIFAPKEVDAIPVEDTDDVKVEGTPVAFTVGRDGMVLDVSSSMLDSAVGVTVNMDFSASAGDPYLAKVVQLDGGEVVDLSTAVEMVAKPQGGYVTIVKTLEKYQVVLLSSKTNEGPGGEEISPEDAEKIAAWWYMNSDDDDPCFIGSAASVSPMLLVALSSMLALVVRRRK